MDTLKFTGEIMLIPLVPMALFVLGVLLLRQKSQARDYLYLLLGVVFIIAGFALPYYTMRQLFHTHIALAVIVGIVICIITLDLYIFSILGGFIHVEQESNSSNVAFHNPR